MVHVQKSKYRGDKCGDEATESKLYQHCDYLLHTLNSIAFVLFFRALVQELTVTLFILYVQY